MRVSGVTVRRRIWFALVAGTVLFSALLIRLGYVQLWEGPKLREWAEQSWMREIPFAAKRGEILDRNGLRLTYNISSPSVMAIPVQIVDADLTANALSPILGMTSEAIKKLITKRTSLVYLRPGGNKMDEAKTKQIRELRLPGIIVAEDNQRFYPYGMLASHILGFTGGYNQGLTGVELQYDKRLQGIGGHVAYLSDAKGDAMPGSSEKYAAPKDGLNLQLTIDSHLQQVLERELDQGMVSLQANHIIGIMMDPNNGEILAMSGRPTFDPARFRDFPVEDYNRNLPIWMTYEPGSTFKIITLAAALQEKKINLKNEHFHDPGWIEVAGARLRCWKRGGHGSETFLEVVENSCNPGFVVMGNRLGKDVLFDYIYKFGFGKKTGIDLQGEENGILFKPSRVGPVELATTSFGQGVSVTPIQQVAAVAAAINGGTFFTPHVGKAWYSPLTGQLVDTIQHDPPRRVISEETSKQVREALESVVAKGTGKNAFLDGYRVGGKTGTAQKVVNGRYDPTEHIVSFIGFAPADKPRVVIYVAVDNPQGIQFGGLVAAPIVKKMMADTLQYLDVKPSKEQIEREYIYGDKKIVEVPNLIGATVTDIYEDMGSDFILARSGTGNTIISQAPSPGTRIEQGSTIRIFLSNGPVSETITP